MTDSAGVWLVTGCSSGFGRAMVEELARRGRRVIATARRPEAIADLAATYPGLITALPLDVTDAAAAREVVTRGEASLGPIGVVVNNAGYGLIGAFEECSDEQVRRNFEVNFFGASNVIRAALPGMRERRGGTIVNISAAAVISNYAGFGAYGAAKSALEGLSEALRAELAPVGVRVMIVRPGPFRTDFIARSMDAAATKIADYDPTSGRFAQMLSKMSGKQPGDPAKAAGVIIHAAESASPPSRLTLGKYAIDKTRKQLAQAGAELERWAEVGAATEH